MRLEAEWPDNGAEQKATVLEDAQSTPFAVNDGSGHVVISIDPKRGGEFCSTKPFTRKKLLATVRQLLDQRGEEPAVFIPSENDQVRFKSLLFDPVTELPTVPVIIDALRDRLLDSRDLAVLYVDVEQYSHIEDAYGWEVFDGLLRHAAKALRRMLGTVFSAQDYVAVNRTGGVE